MNTYKTYGGQTLVTYGEHRTLADGRTAMISYTVHVDEIGWRAEILLGGDQLHEVGSGHTATMHEAREAVDAALA